MGEKSNHPTRRTARKRSRLGGDSATGGGKTRARARRASDTKQEAERPAEERQVFVESVPPAMVAEVFEVAGADDDVIVSTMPPPPARPHARPTRSLSMPPAPHPPRPSARPAGALSNAAPPHPPRRSALPPVPDAGIIELGPDMLEPAPDTLELAPDMLEPAPDTLELAPDTLELAPEDLESIESSSSPAETRTPLLTPLPTEASVRPSRPRVAQRAWLLVGSVALVLGAAVGVRLRAAEPRREAPPSAMVRPHATVTVATASPQSLDVPALVTPNRAVTPPEAPNDGPVTPPDTKGVITPPDTEASGEASPMPSSASVPQASTPASPDTPNPTSTPAPPDVASAPEGTPFDTAAASAAITAAFGRAAACRGPNDPTGSVTATLTYAPSGRVTTATVSGVFAGTPVGGCIASALRGARVPAFSGERLTVRRTAELH
jgi:hypothetical protein